ncbi:class I SAM-dependent methyltransferase [Acinetobacter larvae]|uniref:tRNA (guanine(46)-N(7))-methyltransferase n=1 Tax=Acinetobacter larvae TaxID=1789224 RepID=A0A1B2LW91_9GAMM|nr:DUF938 domain-containing protein [Acinetobacter larvae]AOA57220.1 SAM-dependent methyltransferase [Acinetobacter larvae]
MSIRPFQAQRIHAPRDFQSIPNQPICLEIGAGKGKHACAFAAQHPTQLLYAVERTREKFMAMQKQQQLLAADNLQLVHADAIAWTVHAVQPQQLQQVFILYPNPEPHNAAQRWLNMPFFEFLLSRMAAHATLTLASNISSYIDEAEQQLIDLWKLPYQRETVAQDAARTHFEVKYLARGEVCEQLVIQKPENYRTRFDQQAALQGQKPAGTDHAP